MFNEFFFKLPVFNVFLVEVDGLNVVFLAIGFNFVALVVLGAEALGPLHTALGGDVGVDGIDVKGAGARLVILLL